MSFKYLYCYTDSNEFTDKFDDCHMPLDKYTIKWVKSLKNKAINKRLDAVNNAWANINEALYCDIQSFISNKLNSNIEYTISYNKKQSETTCILPQNRLHAEFIIWHQEKVNELYSIIKRAEDDFERLGIEWC